MGLKIVYVNQMIQDGASHARKTTHVIGGLELWALRLQAQSPGRERLLEMEFNLGANDTISHVYMMGTLIKTADTKTQVSVLGWQCIVPSHIHEEANVSWSSRGGEENVITSCLEPSQTSPNANFLFNWFRLISLR